MKKIIDKVLEAEREAARIQSDARSRVAKMRSETEHEVSEAIRTAREKARTRTAELVASARKTAAEKKEKAIEDAKTVNGHFMEKNAEAMEQLAVEIADELCRVEYSKEKD